MSSHWVDCGEPLIHPPEALTFSPIVLGPPGTSSRPHSAMGQSRPIALFPSPSAALIALLLLLYQITVEEKSLPSTTRASAPSAKPSRQYAIEAAAQPNQALLSV
ncbi:hypothetical protein VTO42DRAFT_2130 [Malbranchea cinnamomea]